MVKKSVLSLALAFIGLLLIVQGANALYAPTIPSSCSSANVSALWDSAFKGVSSSGIVIVNGTSGIKCDEFIAYKINGNLTNVLAGYDTPPYANRTRFYSAFEGNLSSAFQDILRNATNDNLIALNLSLSPSNVAIYTINYGINSIAEANTSFYSIFKAENSSWTSSGSGQNLVYSFSVNESNSSSITSVNGGVYNYSFNRKEIPTARCGWVKTI